MDKKFIKKYYKVGSNHIQAHVSENMFTEFKIHKDGTYNVLITNPNFTKPKIGKKITISALLKEKSIAKVKSDYLIQFFNAIEDISKQYIKQKNK